MDGAGNEMIGYVGVVGRDCGSPGKSARERGRRGGRDCDDGRAMGESRRGRGDGDGCQCGAVGMGVCVASSSNGTPRAALFRFPCLGFRFDVRVIP